MINNHYICVLDTETDSVNPNTCQPVQLAAIMLHPRTLNIIEGSEFNSLMRPTTIDEDDYYGNVKSTIEWHAKNSNITASQVYASWQEAPQQKVVWANFVAYLDRYHSRQKDKNIFTAPLMAGYNIIDFDRIIINRLSEKYGNIGKDGKTNLFFSRDKIDVMDFCFMWFESLPEPLAYSVDALREHFGISSEGSHEAMKDVRDTAEILIKFMKLHRSVCEKVQFKDSFLTKIKDSGV